MTDADLSSATADAASSSDGGGGGVWSDEEIESMILSAVALAVASILVYLFVLRPALASRKDGEHEVAGGTAAAGGANPAAAAGAAGTPNAARGGRRRAATPNRSDSGGSSASTGAGGGDDNDDEHAIASVLRRSRRRPPHLAPNAGRVGLAASALLHEGSLPFRSTAAATYETRLAAATAKAKQSEANAGEEKEPVLSSESPSREKDVVLKNRKERARLFTRLFSPSVTGAARGSVPPPRGSNVVASVTADDASIGCPKLRRALVLLGTYYSLFVVLVLPAQGEEGGGSSGGGDKEEDRLVQGLRDSLRGGGGGSSGGDGNDNDGKDGKGGEIPREVLPDHRIVAVRSVTGRVAFVRQLSHPEFVLDCDPEVKVQLGRFGFTVLVYSAPPTATAAAPTGGTNAEGDSESKKGETSALGKALLP